jgi:hypothetical protein
MMKSSICVIGKFVMNQGDGLCFANYGGDFSPIGCEPGSIIM